MANLISYLNQNFTVPLNSSSTLHVLSLPHCTFMSLGGWVVVVD